MDDPGEDLCFILGGRSHAAILPQATYRREAIEDSLDHLSVFDRLSSGSTAAERFFLVPSVLFRAGHRDGSWHRGGLTVRSRCESRMPLNLRVALSTAARSSASSLVYVACRVAKASVRWVLQAYDSPFPVVPTFAARAPSLDPDPYG